MKPAACKESIPLSLTKRTGCQVHPVLAEYEAWGARAGAKPFRPAPPKQSASWIRHIPAAIEQLGLMPAEIVDRDVVAGLFGLQRTAAVDLLRRLGAERVGKNLAIKRATLMARLREIQEMPEYTWAVDRRQQVERDLERARKFTAARKVKIPVGPDSDQVTMDTLPPGITLTPSRLTIDFFGTEDLLRHLYELSQAVMNDFKRFQDFIET